ncbi:MAG: peptidoglycan-binding protein [Niveispirillum sp.]|uniref:peptidoglycan-binding protein n=1 Tax=Niveispirillum sp. TaxID=1917217 RepID=UPI003BA6404E
MLGSQPFRLKATINGNGGDNLRPDIAKVQVLLNKAGYHEIDGEDGPNGYHSAQLDKDIRKFQQAHNLRVDGKLLPDGETIRTLEERVPASVAKKPPRLTSRNMGYDSFRDQENWARQVRIMPSGEAPLLTPYDLLGMTPVIGDGLSVIETGKALYDGDYKGAAANALGILPIVPGFAGKLAKRAEGTSLAQKKVFIYDAPSVPQRPFSEDYPNGIKNSPDHDEGSPLPSDREGRPLTAPFVAGRRFVGADEKIDPEAMAAIAEGLTGRPIELTANRNRIGSDAGRYVRYGDEQAIRIDPNLGDKIGPRVVAHEVGHAIDDIAGTIPTDGLIKELETVYNTLTNPQKYGPPMKPQHMGYKGDDIKRELMTEAIRAYLTNPNYLKTVAPKTAARIREYANTNPRISKFVQFNALTPLGLGVASSQDESE